MNDEIGQVDKMDASSSTEPKALAKGSSTVALSGIGLVLFCAFAVLIIFFFAPSSIPGNVGYALTEAEQQDVISRNSPLASYAYLSPNADFPRASSIDRITIHHMADDDMSLETLGEVFAQKDRRASSNYAIDKEGNIAIYVEEGNRAWTSGNADNDNRAVTIEVENSEIGGQWKVSDASYNALIRLCADICKRNNIEQINYTGDDSGNLTYHQMFDEDTQCPGPYLINNMGKIAHDVNEMI